MTMTTKTSYPSFPKEEDVKTLENIIRQYPKTDSCELQTLGELRDWQIAELRKLITKLLKEQREICSKDIINMLRYSVFSKNVNEIVNTILNSRKPQF